MSMVGINRQNVGRIAERIVISTSTAASCTWLSPVRFEHGCALSSTTTGSFTPSVLSLAPSKPCDISAPAQCLAGLGFLGAFCIQRRTVRSEILYPSIFNSPWIRGAPQVFSATMRKMS